MDILAYKYTYILTLMSLVLSSLLRYKLYFYGLSTNLDDQYRP